MALFKRKASSSSTENGDDGSEQQQQQQQQQQQKKQKGSWRRPANTAFKQQRLKAWQPILSPRTVLPTVFIVAILFAPIGGLLIWGSSLVSEITLDYTDCDIIALSSSSSNLNFVDVPKFNYRLRSSDAHLPFNPPQYAFVNDTTQDISKQQQCFIRFDVPADLDATVLLYYKLTNFFQNHRRYVKSFDSNQLKGQYVSTNSLSGGNCKPLDVRDGKAVWPCGLIANSLFNDTFSSLTPVSGNSSSSNSEYIWSEQGIAWPGEAKKYSSTPGYDASAIVPPPNWMPRFPNGYNSTNLPNLHTDEHFQNWMRTAGLPTFTKLWGRNDKDKLTKGVYQITAYMNFPVKPYKGTKLIVISTVSWMGGKNPFLGWAYVTAAAVFFAIGIAGLIRHLIKPRRLGDMSLLSKNR